MYLLWQINNLSSRGELYLLLCLFKMPSILKVLTSVQASGSASHRVQCWRKGWWGWEEGNPLYCPGMSSRPGTQTPGRRDRKKRECERWWEGGREEKGKTGRKKADMEMHMQQCIDQTIYWIHRKKHVNSHWVHTASEKTAGKYRDSVVVLSTRSPLNCFDSRLS